MHKVSKKRTAYSQNDGNTLMGIAEIWRRTVDKKLWSWIKNRVTTICFRRTDSQNMKGCIFLQKWTTNVFFVHFWEMIKDEATTLPSKNIRIE